MMKILLILALVWVGYSRSRVINQWETDYPESVEDMLEETQDYPNLIEDQGQAPKICYYLPQDEYGIEVRIPCEQMPFPGVTVNRIEHRSQEDPISEEDLLATLKGKFSKSSKTHLLRGS